jgi:Skp family chaperone for outer membrane proteins
MNRVVVAVASMMLAAGAGSARVAVQAGQTQAPAAQPAQPAPSTAPAAPAPQPPRPFPEGAKLAFVNTQRIAAESAEGRAATSKLKALNDKKVEELNERQKQLQAQQQKLQQGGSVLSDQARGELEKNIERLQVDIQRFTQDAQAEVQELNQELQAEFERKLRPVIAAVSEEKGLHMVFGPDAGIVWADAGLDITSDVIKRFDSASAPK